MNKKIDIKAIAKQTILIESKAVLALTKSINEDFSKSVEAIFNATGRVVVTGIGKSAIIAKKIVATFNSTGTPSIFMHAADAIHGDLGMIRKEDVVLCISKSGNTTEIKVLIPLLKNLGNILIGIVSSKRSYLGEQADFLLHAPVKKEADPNNLAPTTSTTVHMVMGDALATSLLALRGFTPGHFAQFHPGGALGKQLYLKVSDLYVNNQKPAVLPKANIQTIILEITSKLLGATVVVDELDHLIGIITDGDLRRMLEKKKNINSLIAADIMTIKPRSIQKDELAVKALQKMREYSIMQLIVMDNEKYVGIIHLHDLIREGLI